MRSGIRNWRYDFNQVATHRQNSLVLRKNQKLGLQYFGSFPIVQRVGQVAYKLLMPCYAKIHLVFHCSQLKLCQGDYNRPYVPLTMVTNEIYATIISTALTGYSE